MHPFPKNFLWGAATSAYQIEGSPLADGAGMGIWHRFTHTPGRTLSGDTGDVACDHYRRWPQDVELMARLGLDAYRFGLAWTRILPEGRGRVNPKGIDFYSRLIDALLERGIRPLVTLYHWDLPAALDDRGGWLSPDMPDWFADYAEVVFRAFDDRVPLWSTLNEPWVINDGGYTHGAHAPGHRSRYEPPIVTHRLLLSHAAAVERYRAIGRHEIGIVADLEPKEPASASAEDLAATERDDAYKNLQYLDPVFGSPYPAPLREMFGDAWPEWPAEDFARISAPIDFLGVNYYQRRLVRHDARAWPTYASPAPVGGAIYTETGWEVHAPGLVTTLLRVKERYGDIPIYITENGAAFPDPPRATDGRVDDPLRVRFLEEHLAAAAGAIAQGVDLRGYFVWSLLDNFEWASGYSKRFGLVHVDFETQARTVKASGEWYRRFIEAQRSGNAALDRG
jgi:beta-glucosidase